MGVARLIAQGFGGYQGWDDTAAEADFAATGGAGKKTSGGGSPSSAPANVQSAVDQAEALRQFQIRSNQPAIAAQQASIPTTQEAGRVRGETLATEATALDERYQQILGEIGGREARETQEATTLAGRELGRRGVSLQSGAGEQFISERTTPLAERFGELASSTGAQFGQLSRQIGAEQAANPVETQARVDAINAAIGQLQSGDPQQQILAALELSRLQQQQSQFATSEARQSRALDIESQAQTPIEFNDQLFGFNPQQGLLNLLNPGNISSLSAQFGGG